MFKVRFVLLLVSVSVGLTYAVDICEYQLNGTRLAHPADCNKFVVCKDGQTQSIRNCPIGLHFNRFRGVCDLKEQAACDFQFVQLADKELDCTACCTACGCDSNPGTPTPETPSPETPSPETPSPETPSPETPSPETPSPQTPSPETPSPETPTPEGPDCSNNSTVCVGKPDGSVSLVNGTCNQYIVCVGGCASILSCPNNLQYNLATNKCDYPQNVNCPWETKPPITGPSGVACAQPGRCAGKPDGTLFADPNSNGYIVCQCECEIERPCAAGTKFNATLQTCDHINNGSNGNEGGNGDGGESGNGGENGNCGNGGNDNGGNGNGGNGNGGNENGGNGNGGNGNGGNGNGGNENGGNGNGGNGNGGNENGGNGNEGNGNGGNENGGNGNGGNGNGENGNGENGGNGGNGGSGNSNNTICPNGITICQNQTEGALLPVEGECNKFYICNYECAVEFLCPNNLIFNPNQGICDYPQNYKCPWPYTPPSGPNAGPSGIACASGGRCVGKADGTFYPSNESQSKYVICQCECEVELNCPAGLVWDNKLLACNYPANNA